MENEHVLSGLIRKRAEIAGELESAQARVRQLIIDVDNVDATIRLFAPDIDLAEIKPKPLPPRHAAFQGEMTRIILGVLRETGLTLTTRDLALRIMAAAIVISGREHGAIQSGLPRSERMTHL